jgi:hypothetical protein
MISPVNGTRAALIPASRRLTRRLDARSPDWPACQVREPLWSEH